MGKERSGRDGRTGDCARREVESEKDKNESDMAGREGERERKREDTEEGSNLVRGRLFSFAGSN